MSAQRDRLGPEPTMRAIAGEVATQHGLTIDDLRGSDRTDPTVKARHEFIWRARRETRSSLNQIGLYLGGRDHTTILNGLWRHEIVVGERERMSEAGLRFDILRRDKFTCQYCGRKAPDVALHVDHRTPEALGGQTIADNLVTACAQCNLGKGSRPL